MDQPRESDARLSDKRWPLFWDRSSPPAGAGKCCGPGGRQRQASDLCNRGVFLGLLHPGLRLDMEQPFPTELASVSTVMDHSLGGFSRLNSLWVLPHRILTATDDYGTTVIPILQVTTLRPRGVKKCSQSRTAGKWQDRDV